MAPPPEYDKEPKAPDKSATNIPSEDSKALYNLVNEHQINSDSKSTNSSANAEVENNKHVETLDDGQLRALLDEAITYKCPKDREGKSSLFKELLEEVEQDEQDEQACAAAARLGGCRGRRGAARGRRALPHSNSLQDLVAALAAEPAPRRARHNHPPAPVSARAHHGGSLPSGVDTSFLLSEEPMRGAGGGGAEYVATVRCVNPSPLAERRVSASDAPCPDTDALRRSKPVFPMTYTARATLEIGSGSVCSGRAVTTTTASNQVRTPRRHGDEGKRRDRPRGPTEPRHRSFWDDGACLDKWYRGLEAYGSPLDRISHDILAATEHVHDRNVDEFSLRPEINITGAPGSPLHVPTNTSVINLARLNLVPKSNEYIPVTVSDAFEAKPCKILDVKDVEEAMARKAYRERVGRDLIAPSLLSCNPSNVRSMSIGPSLPVDTDKRNQSCSFSDARDKAKDKQNRNTRNKNARKVNVSVVTDKPAPAKPADKKPDNRSKKNRSNAEKIWSPSPHCEVSSHPSRTDKTEDRDIKIDVKEKHQKVEEKPEKISGMVEIIISKEESPNYDPISEKAVTKEELRDDETNLEKDSDLVEMTRKEISRNDENTHGKASDLVEKIIIKVKPQNDTEIVKIDTTDKKRRNDDQTEDDPNLVEMVPLQSSSTTGRTTSEFSQFIENQHRLMRAIESNNRNEETVNTSPCDLESPENSDAMGDQDKTGDNIESNNRNEETINTSPCDLESPENSDAMGDQDKTGDNIESNNRNEETINTSPCDHETPENSDGTGDQDKTGDNIESNNRNEETINTGPCDLETPENSDGTGDQDKTGDNVERRTENPFLPAVDRTLARFDDTDSETQGTEMVEMKRAADLKSDSQLAELPGNASYFLTLYKRFITSPCNIDNTVDIKPAVDIKPLASPDTTTKPLKKKKDKITARLSRKPHNENSNKKKDIIRNALKKLFFDNITQSDSKFAGSTATKEVDSAIPFNCITTPEVVASCTTTASAQAAVPADPKPARLAATTFNGVPLPRAGPAFSAAAAVAQAAAEEFKKSLDENGNSVQGFSSPQSGSSQQKKQRRKKSSKNETVIKSHHIDGYQGNKDLNEVLRFIESTEPERPKRHDDKKKRSAERRKDKAPRASSLDDLSRAAPPPARPARPALPAPKPERRSWGDERQAFYFRDPEPEPEPEPSDFQTVTKKRKPRRRADEPERGERRRPRAPSPPPSPRARSDRSNDSNDDLDSVHSLPALPCRPAPPASYADIARTKHNIPDLIESCNYYGEGSPGSGAGAGAPGPERAPPAPGDADGYPALDPRPARRPPHKSAPPARRPDLVADRRPPVILLDEAGLGRDLDGVTFGFDVNEQLLGGARRREGVAVRAGCARLRYVPPAPPQDDHHLHQIVDYVGTAWEDVVRCGSGKVRYFSE